MIRLRTSRPAVPLVLRPLVFCTAAAVAVIASIYSVPQPLSGTDGSQAGGGDLVAAAFSSEQRQVSIAATAGWQGHFWVPPGAHVSISVPQGNYWTVDRRPEANLPWVGAGGYTNGESIWGGNDSCRADRSAPYGALLARLNRIFPVSQSIQFTADKGGFMDFSINDLEECQGDNAGSLPITVTIG